jgi:hypothetical protein
LFQFYKTIPRRIVNMLNFLKPGPAWRVDPGPGRSEAGTEPGWRKNRERKNPVWPGGLTQSKTWLQPVDFCFYWNDVILIFLKKNWSGQPGQNLKSGFWIGSGLKTMVIFVYKNCESVAKIMGGKTACRLLKRIHLRLNQLNNPHEAAHTMWLRNGILVTSCPKNNKKR